MTLTQRLLVDTPGRWTDSTPVIANAKRIFREEATVPTFCEDVWNLAAMAPPRQRIQFTCNFESIPQHFRLPAKKAIWLLINDGKPDHAVRRGGTKTKKWMAVSSIVQTANRMGAFLRYVAKETPEVHSLRGIVSETMDAYVGYLDKRMSRNVVYMHCTTIRLLHDLTLNLSSPERLPAPSWVDEPVSLGGRGGSDNSTPPMPDAILTPMLLWSVAFVEHFAEDIIAARDAVSAYAPADQKRSSIKMVEAEQLIAAWRNSHGNFLPRTDTEDGGIALSYMCFTLNWAAHFRQGGLKRLLHRFPDMVVSDGLRCAMPTPVNGKVHGKYWQPTGLDYYRLNDHLTDLQSACMFLLGLNSSMRPEELLNLELETVRDDGSKKPVTERIEAPDGQVRHLLYGRTFKGLDGIDGIHRSDGVVRTWAITELGAAAVSVLERLNGRHGRLFITMGPRRSALTLTTSVAAVNLRKFATRARSHAIQLALPAEYTVPEDVEEFMTLSVFRRTSEVLTQQEIGGVLAGAHQAGHRLRDPYDTRVTEGYGGLATQSKRNRRTSDRTGEALANLIVESREGVVGGPAADRALGVANLAAAELELVDPANLMTPVLSNEWKRITKSVGQAVYEVPLAGGTHAYCVFHLPWSACTKDGEEPDVAGCKIACPNKALTMDSVRGLQQRQQELDAAKQGSTAEEVIRADHLIDAYEEQIANSGLPVSSPKKKRPSPPK